MMQLDWNRIRAFLATADAGSLSAAAGRLKLTQPTLSRQVAALEAELGITLFERIGKRLVLTETGETLLAHARAMGQAALAMGFAASGSAQAVEGRVTISATDAYAAYLLPDIVARIRREAPQVTIVIVSSNALSDLQRREADIAIRHVRPEGDTLIGRLVRDSTAHFYASKAWIARHGRPPTMADIAPDDLLGYEETERFAEHLAKAGLPVSADSFRLVSENTVVIWEMVRRGLGIGVMSREIAARTDDIVDLFPGTSLATFPVWLVTHRELRTNRRVRLVFDILAEELARLDRRG
jgi:DNA-binding transcriptional LysR family regulator